MVTQLAANGLTVSTDEALKVTAKPLATNDAKGGVGS